METGLPHDYFGNLIFHARWKIFFLHEREHVRWFQPMWGEIEMNHKNEDWGIPQFQPDVGARLGEVRCGPDMGQGGGARCGQGYETRQEQEPNRGRVRRPDGSRGQMGVEGSGLIRYVIPLSGTLLLSSTPSLSGTPSFLCGIHPVSGMPPPHLIPHPPYLVTHSR